MFLETEAHSVLNESNNKTTHHKGKPFAVRLICFYMKQRSIEKLLNRLINCKLRPKLKKNKTQKIPQIPPKPKTIQRGT